MYFNNLSKKVINNVSRPNILSRSIAMDLTKRDELIEKRNKLNKSLKSTYATLLKENWAMAQEADSEDDVVADVPPVDVTAPEVPPADGAVPPAGDAPVSDEQAKMSTTDFATKYLKTLPSDVDMATAVNDQGIFNTSVNDDQNGQYMVVVFPATKNIREVADILSPVDPAVPTDGGALPPVSDVPPVDAASGLPPVDAAVDEVKEAVCETACDDENKMNESDNEGFYAEKERQRDPMSAGRKNWKSMQESAKKKLNESEDEKVKKEIAGLKKWLEDEDDAEEKKTLQAKIDKLQAKLSSKKISDHAKAKAADSFKNFEHGKDD